MNKLYYWSDKFGALEFPVSSFSHQLITDDFGDLPMISSVRSGDTVNVKMCATNNIKYVKNQKWYENFLVNVITEKVESFIAMSNKFKMFVDFVIYDEKRNPIEEGVQIHPLESVKDVVRIFSVMDDDSLNYIQEKQFQCNLSIYNPASITIKQKGTLLTGKRSPRYLRIRRIQIGAVMKESSTPKGVARLNRTLVDKTIHPVSPTCDDIRNQLIMIYDSCGSSFGVVDFGCEGPRNVNLDINISVSGFFSCCEESRKKISDQMFKNANGDEPDTPNIPDVPEPDNPNEYFCQFERCGEDNPKAGKVISDIEYEEGNYEGRCYPYSKVVIDINDIAIGEWVEYVESLSILSL